MGRPAKPTPEQVLAGLLERVENQLHMEYHDPDRAAEELENMTVKRFLEMLAYLLVD